MPKQKLIDLLYEIMKDSRRSDRELAKTVKVSQPTITRMRKVLEDTGYIREYTVVPALEKLGFEILAFNFLSADVTPKHRKEMEEWIRENQKIVFSSSGEGLISKTLVLASIHKDFTDFSNFVHGIRSSFVSSNLSIESFLVSLKTDVIKHFSLNDLEKI